MTLIDTGQNTMTGGRLKRALRYIKDDEFLLTYGDGVTNSDINAAIAFHRASKTVVTITAVQPSGRFGDLTLEGNGYEVQREARTGRRLHQRRLLRGEPDKSTTILRETRRVLEQEPMSRLARRGPDRGVLPQRFLAVHGHLPRTAAADADVAGGKAPWKIW